MKDSTTIGKINKIIQGLAIALFWLMVWQLAYLGIGRDVYVPSPFSVAVALGELMQNPFFWQTVLSSIIRVLIGVTLSVIFGLSLGVLAGMHSWLHALMSPMVGVIKATPVISFIIIALVWFSSSNVPIFIGFLMCFPIIWTNSVHGIRQVDHKLLQMAQVYKISSYQKLKEIYLPSLVPYLSAGVITALGLGWKVSVAAEVLSHPRRAIGSELHSSKVYIDTPSLFAWTLVVILLSLMFEMVFAKLIRRWVRSTHFGSHRR